MFVSGVEKCRVESFGGLWLPFAVGADFFDQKSSDQKEANALA